MRVFEIWTKMATKCKPQETRFKKFEIWTKMAKLPKPQEPKRQFTLFKLQKHIMKPNQYRFKLEHHPMTRRQLFIFLSGRVVHIDFFYRQEFYI
ncbi:hypothetical protein Hanom_Chr08g00747411 [Helianthus anomalus]